MLDVLSRCVATCSPHGSTSRGSEPQRMSQDNKRRSDAIVCPTFDSSAKKKRKLQTGEQTRTLTGPKLSDPLALEKIIDIFGVSMLSHNGKFELKTIAWNALARLRKGVNERLMLMRVRGWFARFKEDSALGPQQRFGTLL